MTTKRSIGVSAVGLTAAVVAGLVALVLHGQVSDPPIAAAAGPTKQKATQSQQVRQAHQVVVALSRLATDPVALVASGAGPEMRAGARQAVPAGSKVSVAQRSWAPDGIGGGTIAVTVTPPGQSPVSYAAVMVYERGRWKVLATVPLSAASAPTSGAAGGTS